MAFFVCYYYELKYGIFYKTPKSMLQKIGIETRTIQRAIPGRIGRLALKQEPSRERFRGELGAWH